MNKIEKRSDGFYVFCEFGLIGKRGTFSEAVNLLLEVSGKEHHDN